MGFFNRLFGLGTGPPIFPGGFGRFSDAYKEKDKYGYWNKAMSHFDKKEYRPAVEAFFHFITDEKLQNVVLEQTDEQISFKILQGSKIITGVFNRDGLRAKCLVARTSDLNIGMLRKFVELNYELEYSRFALGPDNGLYALMDAHIDECSPYKLYHGLKEMALHVDKEDDILVAEFEGMSAVNFEHVKAMDPAEADIRYKYLQDSVSRVLALPAQLPLNTDKYPGALTYLYLDCYYMLDYLIRPEGRLLEGIESVHRAYFANQQDVLRKARDLEIGLTKIGKISRKEFGEEMYHTVHTFGITEASQHDNLVKMFANEAKNLEWYIDNEHWVYANAVCGFIFGFTSYNYAFPEPVRDLIYMYYHIRANDFFRDLGYTDWFWVKFGEELEGCNIEDFMDRIIDYHDKNYPHLVKNPTKISFDNFTQFSRSLLKYIAHMDLSAKKTSDE